jgi:predicted N-acetyltransferase YhbS
MKDDLTIIRNAKDVPPDTWEKVRALLDEVGMAARPAEVHRKAFENSYSVVLLFENGGGKLIGIGRAISDGAYEAGLYDLAVSPSAQGRGLGRRIVELLMADLGGCNVIFFSAPGKEGFYRRLGFSAMKTGMARFADEEVMRAEGFIV